MLDILLEFMNLPVMLTVYSSILLNFALVYILLLNRNFTYFEISYPIYDQLNTLAQIVINENYFITSPVIVWLQRSTKRYEYSDEEGDISILPTII
mgnify:FL=1